MVAATRPDGSRDFGTYAAGYRRQVAERHHRLRHDAQAVFRSMRDWERVESQEQWEETVE
jgi:hypothetical protein